MVKTHYPGGSLDVMLELLPVQKHWSEVQLPLTRQKVVQRTPEVDLE
jgi:hypothetical protein